MANEPTDTSTIDPMTDDLDAFNELFSSNQKVAQPKTEDVKTDNVETVSEDDETSLDNKEDLDNTSDEEVKDETDDKPKKVNRVQERINELTARAREAERALQALQVAQNSRQNEKTEASSVSVPDTTSPDPNAQNPDGSDVYALGEYDPQYIRDMARHTIETEWARKEQEVAESNQRHQIEQARADLQTMWAEKLTPAIEEHEDFLDKTMELESAFDGLDPNYSDYLVQTIKSLDHGPQVLYYFANNIAEAEKFVKMGPLNATLALGEINAMFKGQTRKEARVSNAPPPPQVNKGSKTRVAVSGDTDDLDAFEQLFYAKRKP